MIIIAGPCVTENLEVCLKVARVMNSICKELGFKYIFKSSFKKANRTRVDSFTGLDEEEALGILRKVKEILKIPVLTEKYYSAFPAEMRDRRDRWLAMVKTKQTKLPSVSNLTPAQQLKLEEDSHRATLSWGVKNLTFPRA